MTKKSILQKLPAHSIILVAIGVVLSIVSLIVLCAQRPVEAEIRFERFPGTTVQVFWISQDEYFAKKFIGIEPSFSDGDSVTVEMKKNNTGELPLPAGSIQMMKTDVAGGDICVDEICVAVEDYSRTVTASYVAYVGILTGFICIGLSLYFAQKELRSVRDKINKSALFKKLHILGEKFSESHLIVFDAKTLLFIAIALIGFFIALSLNLHTSSVYFWNNYLGPSHQQEGMIVGSAKAVRSDEWQVQTPDTFSQDFNDYETENSNVGAAKSPMVKQLPAKHISTILRPSMWGYFLFGAERGFTFEWNIELLGMIIGAFLLFMIVSKNKFWLSLFGAVWLFFAAYNQWWLSSVAGIVASFFFMTVSGVYLMTSQKKWSIVIASVIFTLSTASFGLSLYPPFIITLGFVFGIVMFATVIAYRKKIFEKNIRTIRIAAITLSGIILAATVALFYKDISETVAIVSNTVYPGTRTIYGGGMSITRVFSGYFTFWARQSHFPLAYGNVSETSNFILLTPLLIVPVAYGVATKKLKLLGLQIGLILFITAIIFWMIVPLPEIINKVTLLSNVLENRALLALGVADAILATSLISDMSRQKEKVNYLPAAVAGLFTFAILLILGYVFNNAHPEFLNIPVLVIITLLLGTLTTLISAQKYLLAAVVAVLFLIPTMVINPIAKGTNVFADPDIQALVQEHPGTWAVFEDAAYANLLKAYGADVFNGVKYAPNLELIGQLDPNNAYSDIYNRYAHIALKENYVRKNPHFKLTAQDSYTIHLDPCSDYLKNTGTRYILFTQKPQKKFTCGEELFTRIDGDVTLYAFELHQP